MLAYILPITVMYIMFRENLYGPRNYEYVFHLTNCFRVAQLIFPSWRIILDLPYNIAQGGSKDLKIKIAGNFNGQNHLWKLYNNIEYLDMHNISSDQNAIKI